MAVKFTNGIDLDGTQLLNALLQPVASDPSSPADGQVWYRTDTDTLHLRANGTTTTVAITSQLATNPAEITSGAGAPGSTPSKVGDIYIDTTGDSIYISTDTASSADWDALTTGGGGANLTYTASTRLLESDTGTDVTLPLAVAAGDAGLMTGADKTKLDAISGTNTGDEASATTTTAGVVELATIAETTTGTDTDRAVTPDGLQGITDISGMNWVIDEDAMGSDLATSVPTQQSVKAYVDASVSSSLTYKGAYNASTNSPDLDTSPSGVVTGDTYTVTVAGTFFTTAVEVGDTIIAEADDAATEAEWTIVNRNVDAATATTAGIVELATSAEVDTGTDTTRAVTPEAIRSSTLARKFDQANTGTSTTEVFTHNLASKNCTVSIREVATDDLVIADVEFTSTNSITVEWAAAPSVGEFHVTVVG